jgi:hypothetical protein
MDCEMGIPRIFVFSSITTLILRKIKKTDGTKHKNERKTNRFFLFNNDFSIIKIFLANITKNPIPA